MIGFSNAVRGEIGWEFIGIATVVAAAALAAAFILSGRVRAASGLARIGWLAGLLTVFACGAIAVHFVLFGVHSVPPTMFRRAIIVAAMTLIVISAAVAAAFVSRRLAQKNVLLDIALNNMNHGLMMFDATGGLMLFNQRYVDLYRLPRGKLIVGMTLREIIDLRIANGAFNLDPEAYCRSVLAAIGRGEASRQIITMDDGRIIAVVGEPLASGGWVATHQDITEDRRREESFRFMFEDNPLPMWVWDHATLRILAVNNAACAKYGYTRERFLALTMREIKTDHGWASIEATVRGDSSSQREGRSTVHRKADGSTFDVEFYGRSVTYEGRDASVVALIDITDRKRAETEARDAREFLDTVIETVPMPITVKDATDFRYVLCNRAAEDAFGRSRASAMGKTVYELLPAADADITAERDRAMLAEGRHLVEGQAFPTAKGMRYISSLRVPINGADGKPRYILTVMDDITDRKVRDDELRRTRAFLDSIVENMPAMLTVKNVGDLSYALVNRAAEQLFEMRSEDMIGKTASDIWPGRGEIFDAMDREIVESGELRVLDEHVFEQRSGMRRLLTTKKLPIRGEDNACRYVLTLSEDITDRKAARDKIQHLATHDVLTDLPNRASFIDKLGEVLTGEATANRMFGIVSLDLDRFKDINDGFGAAVGDALLCEVTRRFTEAADGAYLARLGGDEFAVIVTDGAQPSGAEAIASRLMAALAGEIEAGGQSLSVSLSAGIAVFPTDGCDATTLLANANAALYRAKQEGRGTARFFEAHMDESLRDRRALQNDLRHAIEHGQLSLHYQPQAKICGDILGFEVLVRWHHPHRGVVPPGTFIPLAEESGMIMQLGEWVLREACREAASWPKKLQVAVNLSPVQFRDGDLPATVHEILLETGLSPERLELEVTEGVLINDFARAVSILRRLKLLGVRIAMDDFGTGYSSLSYLQSFPFDKIKIDRTFIANLTDNHYSATIVRAVIGLGRGLNLPVMAEGVETAEQLAFLARESCDEVQGYHIGRPAPIEAYGWLIGRKPKTRLKVVAG
jgi:diguanylate cyclase (GGDEF)-like protein/PAS domain S-box-containing protein